MMFFVAVAALSVPNFGPLLDLVGGSTLTLTSIVFPCVFYLYLMANDRKSNEKGNDGTYQHATIKEYVIETLFAFCIIELNLGLWTGQIK
jgi:nitrate/nitrite transporter NarK